MYVKGIRRKIVKTLGSCGHFEFETLQMCIQKDGLDVWVDVPVYEEKLEAKGSGEIHSDEYMKDPYF